MCSSEWNFPKQKRRSCLSTQQKPPNNIGMGGTPCPAPVHTRLPKTHTSFRPTTGFSSFMRNPTRRDQAMTGTMGRARAWLSACNETKSYTMPSNGNKQKRRTRRSIQRRAASFFEFGLPSPPWMI